ncbi:hypothetical protein BS47DRAFT_1349956 [Hydnum rufescens UP504]|uniref:Uncharacterized protein n=1 Tax=Hydnum rufescens UP504 TaxID=1448309 RepID=A0A9P6DNC1_9AGAM|nr:hypothetical protein BS47DRAFT_1349956 [Hydnum rufescens UP504]
MACSCLGECLGHIETLSPGYFGSRSSQAVASCDLHFVSLQSRLICYSVKYIPSWISLLSMEVKKLSKWGEQVRSVIPKSFYLVKDQKVRVPSTPLMIHGGWDRGAILCSELAGRQCY